MDYLGHPVQSSGEVTVAEVPQATITQLVHGECLADLSQLRFRHPDSFSAGELHHHLHEWNQIVGSPASPQQTQVLNWVANKVSIFDYFQPFSGNFKNNVYNSDRPPSRQFRNNYSCQEFAGFVRETLLKRLDTGAITLLGRVREIDPPHLVLPLTVEPSKPRLCHDARFLNLWMRDVPFSLDTLTHLPRYVTPDSYQTILDDKSGYDHILLTEESRTFFGIRWGGWFFLYNTLPFGWKISPYVYHSTGLMASNFFRSIGIPCSLYIDDRHNGQLQVQLHQGAYATLVSRDERNFHAAQTAIFLVAYYLIRLGYFLALSKSILKPQKVVPYLGFLSDSLRQGKHFYCSQKRRRNLCCWSNRSSRYPGSPPRPSNVLLANVFHLHSQSRRHYYSHVKCILRYPKPYVLVNRFRCTPRLKLKFRTGSFWRRGMIPSHGEMKSMFACRWHQTPRLQDGALFSIPRTRFTYPITGNLKNKVMILPRKKRQPWTKPCCLSQHILRIHGSMPRWITKPWYLLGTTKVVGVLL